MEGKNTRELWLKCIFQPNGNPDSGWITKIIRQPIPSEDVSAKVDTQLQNVKIEEIEIKKDLMLLWLQAAKISNLPVDKQDIKILINNNLNQPFFYSQQRFDVHELNNFEHKLVRKVNPEDETDPWIVDICLQTTSEQQQQPYQNKHLNENITHSEINNPESSLKVTRSQYQPDENNGSNLIHNATLRNNQSLRPTSQSAIDQIQTAPLDMQRPDQLQLNSQSRSEFRDNDNQLPLNGQEESKNAQPPLGHSYSIQTTNTTITNTKSDKEVQDEITRQVYRKIRMMHKPKAESKISQKLNVTFGMLPGISEEQMSLINQNIENEQLSQFLETEQTPIDMVFMYSEPLVQNANEDQIFKMEQKEQKEKVEQVKKEQPNEHLQIQSQELQIKKEYRQLKRIIDKHCISFSIEKQNATCKSLEEIVSKGVKILHLVCHGLPESQKQQTSLLFEHKDEVGVQDRIGIKRITEIFENQGQSKVELILITACYSQDIAKFIKSKLSNTIVIAINKFLPVLDEAATKFAQEFYDKLLQGETPLNSIESAKKYVRISFRNLACCCHHIKSHQAGCKMKKHIDRNMNIYRRYFKENAQELALCDACFVHDALAKCRHGDQQHQVNNVDQERMYFKRKEIPECTCDEDRKQRNQHLDDCPFFLNFCDNYQIQETRPVKHLCCCHNDDFPHNEDEKFTIIQGDNEDQKKLSTPLYQQFNPGNLIDQDDTGNLIRESKLQEKQPYLFIERNKIIFDVVQFLTNSLKEEFKVLSLLGDHESGNDEIAVFAAQYCLERKKIMAGVYFDLSKMKKHEILDRLNRRLDLDVSNSSHHQKYLGNIIEKMSEKFGKKKIPVTLIIEILKQTDSDKLDLFLKLIKGLKIIKVIFVEKTPETKSQINFGMEIKTIQVGKLRLDKIKSILGKVCQNEGVTLQPYSKAGLLNDSIVSLLNNHFRIIKFVSLIEKGSHEDNPNLIQNALDEILQPNEINNDSSKGSRGEGVSLKKVKENEDEQYKESNTSETKLCLACQKKLNGDDDEDDYQDSINSSPTKVIGPISFTEWKGTLKSSNALIEHFRKNNPFDYQVSKHIDRFKAMSNDNISLEIKNFQVFNGKYYGEVKKETRIQHGRGVYIDTKNESVYEGWRVRNKREIYGRFIDKNGLVYEGEFRNNEPHGQGKMWQCQEINGVQSGPRFNGSFQNGQRDDWGILKIPSNKLTYFGQFNNNRMDDIFKVLKDDGDCFLENYYLDKKENDFRKVYAYVFIDKMYGVIPIVQEMGVDQMTKRAYQRVDQLIQQGDKQLNMMDIEEKTPEMLSNFHFASLWLQYQAENKPNTLLLELLQGKHPKVKPLNHLIVRIRGDFNIEQCKQQGWKREIAQFQMVAVKRVVKKINEESIQYMQADQKAVDEVMQAAEMSLHELMHIQEGDKINKWEKVLKILISDEQIKGKILEEISFDEDQKIQQYQLQQIQSITSNDQFVSSTEVSSPPQKFKPSIQHRAQEMFRSMKEAELMSQPIREYYNLSRLIQEQDFKEGKMYQVLNKEDIIQSLLEEQPKGKLLEYRLKLGKVFLEMCLSLHYVNSPVETCIQDFMNSSVLDLFEKSGYHKIAIDQYPIHIQSDISQQTEEETIKDFFDIKNLKNNLKEDDIRKELVDKISQQIGCEQKSEAIIDKALEIIEFKINQKAEKIEAQIKPETIGVEIFFNFLGAIAQLINPALAVKFILDMLRKLYPVSPLNETYMQKARKLYKFRKMQELEKHIAYEFKDLTILVQSLTHESYESHLKQSGLERTGKHTLKFVFLRQLLLNSEDLGLIEKFFNSDIFTSIVPYQVSILATLLRLQSKLIYKKGQFELRGHDYFQNILSVFQMTTEIKSQVTMDYSSMIDNSLQTIEKFKPDKEIYSLSKEGEKQFSPMLNQTLFAFVGALSLDSSLNDKTFNSLCTLLPFLFNGREYRPQLKQECMVILEEKQPIIPFAEIFRVSKEAFKEKTFSINDCFDHPGKLFNIFEFDLYNEESYKKLVEYVKTLEYQSKHKLINIMFNEENFTNSNNYVDSSYYIVHSYVVSVCLKKEEETERTGLVKEFITKMRNANKQRVINEQQMLIMTKEQNSGLTLAQKIKMLINLNQVQYQNNPKDAEKLYEPLTVQEAQNYVNTLNFKKEKTFDSLVYTISFKETQKGISGVNSVETEGQKELLQFIKQPLLQAHEGDSDTLTVIQKNKKCIFNNILENQLIQLSHFLSNQESAKQNELIILDEEQLRVVDYMALRQETQKITSIKCPVELLSVCLQVLAYATESLHDFGLYHGNIKPERIKFSPSGYDGFLYNGNLIVLKSDNFVKQTIIDNSFQPEIKNKTPDNMPLYLVDKFSPLYCTNFIMAAKKNMEKLTKCELYREEAFQIMNVIFLVIYTQKKDQAQNNSKKEQATGVLQKIKDIMKTYKDLIKEQLELETIIEVQEILAEDWTIAADSISLFRACLQPTFSRNLWIFLDNLSPLHPKLQQLVFPWKQSRNKPIDIQKLIASYGYQTDTLSSNAELTMTRLRKLHLSFIEDWWYEIASLMEQDSDRYKSIDRNELEYVKSMVHSGNIRVKFEWLSVKIMIIKYFKACNQPSMQVSELEESKSGEIVQYQEPSNILKNIYSRITQSEQQQLGQFISQSQSFSTQQLNDEHLDQNQLRHFVKAAIYPLNDIYIKIYKAFGQESLKEYVKLIKYALENLEKASFKKKMTEAFNNVIQQSSVLKIIQ